MERLYHNAFPEVQRSQLERRESGEALKCAMEVLDIFEPLAGLHPGAQGTFVSRFDAMFQNSNGKIKLPSMPLNFFSNLNWIGVKTKTGLSWFLKLKRI